MRLLPNYCPTANQTEVRGRPRTCDQSHDPGTERQADYLDDITSSYQFHRELESPVAFVRREWQALAVFGGGFVAVLLLGVLAVDPAYFYPRLATDPLLYYLKGLAFAETGHAIARSAINRVPFDYVSMPGILRSPFIAGFRDFDDQLRAIQLSNIALVAATGVMFSYILSWALPRSRHWMGIGYTFGFLLLSPDWVANVFAPLADAPYAAFSIAVLIITALVIRSDAAVRRRPVAIAAGATLFVLAFLVKYTAPVLLFYGALLAAGRARQHGTSRRTLLIGSGIALSGVVVLVLINWTIITRRYLYEPIGYLLHAPKKGMFLNFFGLAIPSQIIPDFQLAFARNPMVDAYRPVFGGTAGDVAITVAGIGVSLIVFFGMWKARKQFLPEIAYCLAALPVLGLMIPSTARYLMAYQPLVWIFFYVGAAALLRPLVPRFRLHPLAPITSLSLMLLIASGLVYVRSQRIVGVAGNRSAAISLGETRGYINQIASTFGDLRRFLETLPKDRALLIGAAPTVGRWKVISGLDYYRPDSGLSVAAREHDVYVVLECGTLELCQDFDAWEDLTRRGLRKYGDFSLDPVFSRASPHAKAKVLRLKNVE